MLGPLERIFHKDSSNSTASPPNRSMKTPPLLLVALLTATAFPRANRAQPTSTSGVAEGIVSAKVIGAKADGVTDDTAALQKALDEASRTGGRVWLPPGRYLVKGSLRVPPGVTLQGAMESPVWSEPLNGSIVLATGGRDQEDGPALFELGHSAAVRGLTVFYPEQVATNIHAYAWTFHLQGVYPDTRRSGQWSIQWHRRG